jgi:hypothetical protein
MARARAARIKPSEVTVWSRPPVPPLPTEVVGQIFVPIPQLKAGVLSGRTTVSDPIWPNRLFGVSLASALRNPMSPAKSRGVANRASFRRRRDANASIILRGRSNR